MKRSAMVRNGQWTFPRKSRREWDRELSLKITFATETNERWKLISQRFISHVSKHRRLNVTRPISLEIVINSYR